MTPENVEKTIRLLHASTRNTLDALQALVRLIDAQQAQIRILNDKVESLEANRVYVNEQQYLKELDIADGKWYREVNGLG